MKKIIKFLRLKCLKIRLLRAYKKAIIEAEVNEIKYRACNYYMFIHEVEKIHEEWHKVRYDK